MQYSDTFSNNFIKLMMFKVSGHNLEMLFSHTDFTHRKKKDQTSTWRGVALLPNCSSSQGCVVWNGGRDEMQSARLFVLAEVWDGNAIINELQRFPVWLISEESAVDGEVRGGA